MGIARHKVEDHYRRTLRGLAGWDESVAEGLEDGAPPVDEDLDRQQRSQAARRVLADMPEHYATVLLWRYWEGRSSREIAEASQRTEKAVERLLARARDNFRRRWQDVARRAG
jgi:RNA polymerase sigma factor (sigma-70 family)